MGSKPSSTATVNSQQGNVSSSSNSNSNKRSSKRSSSRNVSSGSSSPRSSNIKPSSSPPAATSSHDNNRDYNYDRPQFDTRQCETWFAEYADPDTPDTIGPEGAQRFFEDLGLSVEDILVVACAWKMNARTIGYISKEEWMTGMQALNTDSQQKLQKRLPDLAAMVKDHTDELYRFSFNYAKNPDQRCMDVEIACFLWRTILAEKYPIVNDFTEFLEQNQPVKVINRDQWLSFYDFVDTVSPDLSDYDEMSAWPTLFDEFVEWKKQ